MFPPSLPFAVTVLPAVTTILRDALRTMLPSAPRTALFALMTPLFRTRPA